MKVFGIFIISAYITYGQVFFYGNEAIDDKKVLAVCIFCYLQPMKKMMVNIIPKK